MKKADKVKIQVFVKAMLNRTQVFISKKTHKKHCEARDSEMPDEIFIQRISLDGECDLFVDNDILYYDVPFKKLKL